MPSFLNLKNARAVLTPARLPPSRRELDRLPTGIPELDRVTGALPRGAIAEVVGTRSSGRTSVAYAIVAEATARQETSAWIDACDSLDPASARAAGVDLDRLLWVRCAGALEPTVRAADLVLQGGGFSVVVLDLGGFTPEALRRIPMSYWHRFRLAVEKTPTLVLVIAREACAGSSAALVLRATRRQPIWAGPARYRFLESVELGAERRKPEFPAERSCTFKIRPRAV